MLGEVVSAIAALGMMQQAPAASGAALQPSGKWIVDYQDSMCTLARDFGEGETKFTFALKPTGAKGQPVDAILVLPGRSRLPTRFGGQMRALPSDTGIDVEILAATMADGTTRVVRFPVDYGKLMDMREAERIELPVAPKRTSTIAPRTFSAAIDALYRCQDDLMVSNGASKAELDHVVVPAQPIDASGWITSDDYPIAAMSSGEEGTVAGVWRITAEGRVEQCRVIHNSGAEILARNVCRLIERRARYEPARDAAGNAVPTWDVTRVIWVLP